MGGMGQRPQSRSLLTPASLCLYCSCSSSTTKLSLSPARVLSYLSACSCCLICFGGLCVCVCVCVCMYLFLTFWALS
jgi:hypothetical protein